MSDIADTVAGFVEEAATDGPKLRSKARILLVDALALAVGARDVAGMPRLVSSLSGGSGVHHIRMTGYRVGTGDAALVNGVCAHARFQDDTDMTSWSHPGSFVVPAAVAAAEGQDLIWRHCSTGSSSATRSRHGPAEREASSRKT